MLCKTSSYCDPSVEMAIAYDDPQVGIEWPRGIELVPSGKDAAAPRLGEVVERLVFT